MGRKDNQTKKNDNTVVAETKNESKVHDISKKPGANTQQENNKNATANSHDSNSTKNRKHG